MTQNIAAPELFFDSSSKTRKNLHPPLFADQGLLVITTALVLFSFVVLYSTTGVSSQEKFGDSFFYVKRQVVAGCIGFFVLYLCSRLDLEKVKKFSPFLIFPVLAMLLLTFIPGLGDAAGGAQRWLKIGFVRFQPGEFVKLFFIIFMAGFFARHQERIAEFSFGIIRPVLLAGMVGSLLLLQPDFGSASIIVIVTLAMSLAAGARLRFLGFGILAVLTAGALLIAVSPYRMARILSFLSPFADPAGRGYQLIQSLIAVGSGQMIGVGLGSSQQKLFYLPAAHTDFIFAVVSEELGFVGATLLIISFMLFLWRGLKIAARVAEDSFVHLLAVGLTLLVVVPALLNVGVVIGILPTKGLVLPLVGYGGSSLIASLAGIGLLLGIARQGSGTTR